MKIAAIGDPHGSLQLVKKIPLKGVDLILLTGDLGKADLARKQAFTNIERRKKGLPEIEFSPEEKKKAFMEAYDSTLKLMRYLVQIAPVFTIYGNVESSNSYTRKYSKEIGLPLPFLTDDLNKLKNFRLINNKLVNFDGVRIGGLEYFIDENWVREFRPGNYRKRLKEARKDTAKARRILKRFRGLDILVCHQPPYGILDKVNAKFAPKHWKGKHAGSKTIYNYIKRNQPTYVFCGHIHEGEGFRKIGKSEVYNLGVGGYQIIEI